MGFTGIPASVAGEKLPLCLAETCCLQGAFSLEELQWERPARRATGLELNMDLLNLDFSATAGPTQY